MNVTIEPNSSGLGYVMSYGPGNKSVHTDTELIDGFYVLYQRESGSTLPRSVFGVAQTEDEADRRLHDILIDQFTNQVTVQGIGKMEDLEDKTKYANS